MNVVSSLLYYHGETSLISTSGTIMCERGTSINNGSSKYVDDFPGYSTVVNI